jgi:farnesyl-diphosphate farnesyltransferase
MIIDSDILRVLEDTSRTFLLPILRLPKRLQEAIGLSYLCMRAIDEIEDHNTLHKEEKISILRAISQILQAQVASNDNDTTRTLIDQVFLPYPDTFSEVTLRLPDWLFQLPHEIAPRVWDAIIGMTDRMSYWVGNNWQIKTEADLDGYTYSVAGAVGLLICDIWAWYDGTQINRLAAIHFGRGLQSVNILRNRAEDRERGADFFPHGWSDEKMQTYAQKNLSLAKEQIRHIKKKAFRNMVDIPLALAEGTLQAIISGQPKLTRNQVMEITGKI